MLNLFYFGQENAITNHCYFLKLFFLISLIKKNITKKLRSQPKNKKDRP